VQTSGAGEFDTVVVGSGPGGATVARELSRRGERVLILERGRNAPIRGRASQAIADLIWPGRGLAVTPDLLALGRGITTGGSSVFYYATAFDPPLEMFRRHGVELAREVEAIKAELPFGPLADRLIGPAASRITSSAQELGYRWAPLPKFVDQDRCRPDCDRCTVGCPHGAKWTARVFVAEAVEHGAELLTGARVRRVVRSNGSVAGVEASVSGHRRNFTAGRVVLAAGGIGSAVILRASGIERAGRDFFFDPLVVVQGEVEGLKGGREFPMATGVHLEDIGCVLTDLCWPRWFYQLFAAQVGRLDRLLAHRRTLPIMVKVQDELGGRLTDRGGVRKRLSAADRRRLQQGSEHARRILARAGARRIFSTWRMATHPGGTAKIGDVVDADLQTEIEGLYVCDCSVVPEAWGLPPTLTILALAKRLARHLGGEAAAV
jgi:choline dehydrogenase-like flavoprotein